MATIFALDGSRIGDLSDPEQPAHDPFAVRRLPLSHDVLEGFVVLYTIPSGEAVDHPLAASRTLCLMPDGRYVVTEMSGSSRAVIGEPMTVADALDAANRILAFGPQRTPSPLDAHSAAVGYMILALGVPQLPPRLPSARGAA